MILRRYDRLSCEYSTLPLSRVNPYSLVSSISVLPMAKASSRPGTFRRGRTRRHLLYDPYLLSTVARSCDARSGTPRAPLSASTPKVGTTRCRRRTSARTSSWCDQLAVVLSSLPHHSLRIAQIASEPLTFEKGDHPPCLPRVALTHRAQRTGWRSGRTTSARSRPR